MIEIIFAILLFILLFGFIGWASHKDYQERKQIIENIKKRGHHIIKMTPDKKTLLK